MIRNFLRFAPLFVGLFCPFFRLVGAEHQDARQPPHFVFRRIFLSDSATRVFLLRLPPRAAPVAVDNLPLLSTPEFAEFIRKFLGTEITRDSLVSLVNGITDYAHRHGQPRVSVTLPPQNVANGDVHLVVVLGRYNLQRLILSDTDAHAAAVVPGPKSGQIIVDHEPVLDTQAFARDMTPHFGQPITAESIDAIGNDIAAYVKSRGDILAHIGAPRQDVSQGVLRLGVTIGRFPLRRVVIAETPREAASAVVPANAGFAYAANFPLFATDDFRRLVARYIGLPISRDRIVQLRNDVSAYVKRHDRLAVAVPDPEVNLARGEVRMSVVIARYGQIQFRGNRWFSSQLLAGSLGFKAGDEIRVSELEAAVNRTNQNPFRHVDVLLNGLTSTAAANGDVPIAVQETEIAPYRATFSYDDTGNDVLGNDHYTGAFTVGDLWGLDHQFSYQYTTADNNREYQSQLANYRAPLPWHDYIVLAAAYSDYDAAYDEGVFHLEGDNVVLDGRYVHPIFGDDWSLELSLGFDYKQISTRLLYGSIAYPVIDTVNTIGQYTAGATYVQHDKTGSWVAGFTLNASPGDFNARNTDARFQGNLATDPTTGQPIGGPEAQARYLYGTGTMQRIFLLPDDFQLWIRGQGQLSSARLLSSERMAIGGEATVRGYDERIMDGDEGWQFSTELRSPALRLHVPFTPERYARLENRVLAFFDDGRVDYRHPRPDDFPLSRLTSTGVGLRTSWASNFSLAFDYGWQLKSTGPGVLAQPNRSRGHLQATLSY